MADIVWTLQYRTPSAADADVERMLDMARLWLDHLRGPGQHKGPVRILSNFDPGLPGTEVVRFEADADDRFAVFAARPGNALKHFDVDPSDRLMQADTDALARHPIAPLFDGIREGEMRVAPSGLTVMDRQHLGHMFPKWRRRWLKYGRRWKHRIGVSASFTGMTGRDWPNFMGEWSGVIEQFRGVPMPEPRPGDQGYLNYLHAFGRVPMRRFGPDEIHHLRVDDPAPRDTIAAARFLHFPVPNKMDRMREWSVV